MPSDSKPIEDMTDAELSRAIAIECNRWTELNRRRTTGDMPPVWVNGYGSRVFAFEPASNIAHAFDALEAGRQKGIDIDISASDAAHGWTFCMSNQAATFVTDSGSPIPFDKLPRYLMVCLLTAVRALEADPKPE